MVINSIAALCLCIRDNGNEGIRQRLWFYEAHKWRNGRHTPAATARKSWAHLPCTASAFVVEKCRWEDGGSWIGGCYRTRRALCCWQAWISIISGCGCVGFLPILLTTGTACISSFSTLYVFQLMQFWEQCGACSCYAGIMLHRIVNYISVGNEIQRLVAAFPCIYLVLKLKESGYILVWVTTS